MELKTVRIEKPEDINFILGQSHFIKTVEDIYETMVGAMPGAKFGVAFCEASGPCLVRFAGTDAAMIDLAQKNALALSAGHIFIIFMTGMFPVNVLNAIKNVPEVCRIFCATANPANRLGWLWVSGLGMKGQLIPRFGMGWNLPHEGASREQMRGYFNGQATARISR